MRDGVSVVAQVLVVGVFQIAVRFLQLDEQQRYPVNESDQVGAPPIQIGVDPEL